MTLRELTPMLYVNDLEETISFYEKLGFTMKGKSEGWAHMQCDSVSIMFAIPPPEWNVTKIAFSGSLYKNPENVKECWDRLKDIARICHPIEDFNYGMREFAIYDCNGYLLQFGQPLTNLVAETS